MDKPVFGGRGGGVLAQLQQLDPCVVEPGDAVRSRPRSAPAEIRGRYWPGAAEIGRLQTATSGVSAGTSHGFSIGQEIFLLDAELKMVVGC